SCLSPPAPEPLHGRHRRPGCPHFSRRLLRQKRRTLAGQGEGPSRFVPAVAGCRVWTTLGALPAALRAHGPEARSLAVLAGAFPASPGATNAVGAKPGSVSWPFRPRSGVP